MPSEIHVEFARLMNVIKLLSQRSYIFHSHEFGYVPLSPLGTIAWKIYLTKKPCQQNDAIGIDALHYHAWGRGHRCEGGWVWHNGTDLINKTEFIINATSS